MEKPDWHASVSSVVQTEFISYYLNHLAPPLISRELILPPWISKLLIWDN